MSVWLVAEFEALSCQVTLKFIRCRNAETRTITAIKYTACYALAVLVCPCVRVKLLFHIKLVKLLLYFFISVCVAIVLACFNFFFLALEKNFEVLSGLGQTHSLASFGLSLGLWVLTMCVAAA